jgi:hypothetical protein
MKTLNTFILALSATAVLGTTALYAQTVVFADVPFDFTAQTVTVPAGRYALQPLSRTSGVIRMMNLETHRSVQVLAPSNLSTYNGKDTDSGKLIFHRYGDQYFFSEVWTPGGFRGGAAPSRQEREIKARGAERQIAFVGIRRGGAPQ